MATQKIVKKIYKNGQEYLIYGSGGASIEVDSTLSDSSENPVQNKVVKGAIDGKANSTHSHSISDVTNLQNTLNNKISNPSGGSAGQYLKKTSNGEAWADVDTLPSGGTAGQVLTKTNNGADWEDLPISDTAFGSSWDGDTTHAPSKNAVYDKISSMDTTISGKLSAETVASGDSGVSYTLKVANSAPASGTANTIITIVTD